MSAAQAIDQLLCCCDEVVEGGLGHWPSGGLDERRDLLQELDDLRKVDGDEAERDRGRDLPDVPHDEVRAFLDQRQDCAQDLAVLLGLLDDFVDSVLNGVGDGLFDPAFFDGLFDGLLDRWRGAGGRGGLVDEGGAGTGGEVRHGGG